MTVLLSFPFTLIHENPGFSKFIHSSWQQLIKVINSHYFKNKTLFVFRSLRQSFTLAQSFNFILQYFNIHRQFCKYDVFFCLSQNYLGTVYSQIKILRTLEKGLELLPYTLSHQNTFTYAVRFNAYQVKFVSPKILASSWLSRVERQLRTCVERNVADSSLVPPIACNQYHLPFTVYDFSHQTLRIYSIYR